MNQLLAYEIAAIFLVAGMLMFGTLHGFLPKWSRFNGVVIGVLVAIGFSIAAYCWIPQVKSLVTSILPRPESAPAAASVAPPEPSPTAPKPAASPAPAARAVHPVSRQPVAPEPVQISAPKIIIVEVPQAQPEPVHQQHPSDYDPYDSGIKRGAKRVGRFLHLTHTAK